MNVKAFVVNDPKIYVKFGKCNACGAVVVIAGTKAELWNKFGLQPCKVCHSGNIFFGARHKASGWWAKRKYEKLEKSRVELPYNY